MRYVIISRMWQPTLTAPPISNHFWIPTILYSLEYCLVQLCTPSPSMPPPHRGRHRHGFRRKLCVELIHRLRKILRVRVRQLTREQGCQRQGLGGSRVTSAFQGYGLCSRGYGYGRGLPLHFRARIGFRVRKRDCYIFMPVLKLGATEQL